MSYRAMGENLFASTALALVASLMAASATHAADEPAEVETLIVTANKRAENIQDVPMSVSAVSGDYLEKVGIGNVTELSRFVPSEYHPVEQQPQLDHIRPWHRYVGHQPRYRVQRRHLH